MTAVQLTKKLNILFIPRWYPNRVAPLNGIFIKRHALAVAGKHRVGVLFVNADPGMKGKTYDLEQVVEDGIFTVRVYYNNSVARIPVLSSLIKFYRYGKACRMGIKEVKEKFGTPDISHIHVLSRTFMPARHFKVPFIVSEQWSGYLPEDGTYKGFLKKMFTRRAVRKASAVTTVSESLKNAMLDHGLTNAYTVIPNVVDTKLFYPARDSVKKDKFFFLHVSNLDDRAKNVSGMIRAVKKISESRNDIEFIIVGDGEDRQTLELLAGQALNRNIFFLGWRSSTEVAVLMKSADIFLLFSNYDNMPCVMLEAMASGLPVIGSDIHGIGEHVKEGRGVLVPAGNEEALCKAILKAMNDITLFDKGKLHAYAKENFSYEAVAAQFDSIYQKVIRK